MSYFALKHLHVTCVILSGLGFSLRGWWMWQQSPRLNQRLVRLLPHAIDTLLLTSALSMAWMSGQFPFAQNWLTAKFLGLVAYVVLGAMALKRGRTLAVRRRFLVLALVVYAYIVSVALSRNPVPWL